MKLLKLKCCECGVDLFTNIDSTEHTQAITIDQDTAYMLLVSAVRYALGRHSYIVGDTCDTVKHLGRHLTVPQLRVILRDVREHQERDAKWEAEHGSGKGFGFGFECDERDWADLATWLEAEIERRDKSA